MVTIITSIISAVTAIIVAWLGKRAADDKRDREKRQKQADERESRREKRDSFLLKYMELSADLAEAQTIAIVNGQTNGELKRAQEELKKLRTEYSNWLISIAAHN